MTTADRAVGRCAVPRPLHPLPQKNQEKQMQIQIQFAMHVHIHLHCSWIAYAIEHWRHPNVTSLCREACGIRPASAFGTTDCQGQAGNRRVPRGGIRPNRGVTCAPSAQAPHRRSECCPAESRARLCTATGCTRRRRPWTWPRPFHRWQSRKRKTGNKEALSPRPLFRVTRNAERLEIRFLSLSSATNGHDVVD